MPIFILLLLSLFPALVITAGLRDVTSMTIPNWISLVLTGAFIPAAWIAGLDPMAIAGHLGVGFGVLLLGMGLFAGRVIGGGDAKLMAASALWLGLGASGVFLMWTGLAGGLFCVALIAARNNLQAYTVGADGWFKNLMEPKGDIPYGVAICIGALAAFPDSPLALGFATLA